MHHWLMNLLSNVKVLPCLTVLALPAAAQDFEFTQENVENVDAKLNEHLGNDEGSDDWVDLVPEQSDPPEENEWWIVIDNHSKNPNQLGGTFINPDGTTLGSVVFGYGGGENFPGIGDSTPAAEEILLQILIHEHGHSGGDVGGASTPHRRDDEPGPEEEEPVRTDHCLHLAQIQGDATRICDRVCALAASINMATTTDELEEICSVLKALCELHEWLAARVNGPENSSAADDCPEVTEASPGKLVAPCDCCDFVSDLCSGGDSDETQIQHNDYQTMPH